MNFELNAAFSLTTGIGALIGWIRIRKTDPAFFPFLLWLLLGFLHELLSLIIVENGYSNAFSYNLFTLAESLLICYQFYRWGLFEQQQKLYYLIQTFFAAAWLTELLLRQGLETYFSYFIIGYSTLIVFMAINVLNNVLFKEPGLMLFQPEFLICMGLIVYFTYTILIEIFWFYGLNKSSIFRIRIYELFGYINLFTNLVFAFATLWIPMKRQYIMRS